MRVALEGKGMRVDFGEGGISEKERNLSKSTSYNPFQTNFKPFMEQILFGIAVMAFLCGYTLRTVSKDLFLKGEIPKELYGDDSFVGICVMVIGVFFLLFAFITKIYGFFF